MAEAVEVPRSLVKHLWAMNITIAVGVHLIGGPVNAQ